MEQNEPNRVPIGQVGHSLGIHLHKEFIYIHLLRDCKVLLQVMLCHKMTTGSLKARSNKMQK